MCKKNKSNNQKQFIPIEDIEKIDTVFLDEIERVKTRVNGVSDKELINTFYNVLMKAYSAEIDLQTCKREVDYDIKFAEIKARRHALKPWRRCWLWRLLLFFPLTNRAQDINEERAELDADISHTAAEKAIEDDRKKLPQKESKKLSKRKLKREMKKKLKAVIERADKADVQETFKEPATATPLQESAEPAQEPRQEQIPLTQIRRARPPRGCRKG